MRSPDGTGKERTVDEATLGLTRHSARLVDNIVLKRQTGLIALPKLQTAVADIVAMDHRATELEAVVGRYTSFATCTMESSAIAVPLDRNPLENVESCLASGPTDIADLAHTQNFQAPVGVRSLQKRLRPRSDFCPSLSGLAGVVLMCCSPARWT